MGTPDPLTDTARAVVQALRDAIGRGKFTWAQGEALVLAVLRSQPTVPVAALKALEQQWREMSKSALAEGAIPGDGGHSARWYAIEIAADELAALIAHAEER